MFTLINSNDLTVLKFENIFFTQPAHLVEQDNNIFIAIIFQLFYFFEWQYYILYLISYFAVEYSTEDFDTYKSNFVRAANYR